MYDYIKQQHKSIKNQERERERMLSCAASNYLIEFVIPCSSLAKTKLTWLLHEDLRLEAKNVLLLYL